MILVIDTATAACSVALLHDGEVVDERHDVVGRGHAERLVPQIAELFAPHGGRADAILVDCGPGSFTGVRVGLAAARALGLGWQVTVCGYSSMALIAAGAFTAHPDVAALCVAINGGHGEIFVRRFTRAPGLHADDLVSLLPVQAAQVVSEALVVGSGAAALVAARGSGVAREWLPRAADAVLLGSPWAGLPPVPIYGRPPDAKVPAR